MSMTVRSGSIAGITTTFESGFRAGEFDGVDQAQDSVRRYAEKLRSRGLDSEARAVERAAQVIWQDFNSKTKRQNDIKELDKDSLRKLL